MTTSAPTRLCVIEGCQRKHYARTWCSMHYLRWLNHGSPFVTLVPRHGHAGLIDSPTYLTWKSMIARCSNPRAPDYPRYGGRGIAVCERWRTFANFLEDMGERPDGLTIDRENNDGDYELLNCRWATRSQQNSNRRPMPLRQFCRRGHPLTADNLYVWRNVRRCQTCRAVYQGCADDAKARSKRREQAR